MASDRSLLERLDKGQEAVVRFLCDSNVGYGVILVAALLTGWFGMQRPIVLWLGGASGVLIVALRVLAGLRARPGGLSGQWRSKDSPWAYTPLALADGQPTGSATVRFTRPQLRALLEASARSGKSAELYLPVYGKTFQLLIDPDEEPNSPSAKAVKTVNDILRWSETQRASIRALLVANAEAAGSDIALDAVEALVAGGTISVDENVDGKSRLATLHVNAPWGHEGSVEIVILDGEPIDVGGRHLELRAYDAAYDEPGP